MTDLLNAPGRPCACCPPDAHYAHVDTYDDALLALRIRWAARPAPRPTPPAPRPLVEPVRRPRPRRRRRWHWPTRRHLEETRP